MEVKGAYLPKRFFPPPAKSQFCKSPHLKNYIDRLLRFVGEAVHFVHSSQRVSGKAVKQQLGSEASFLDLFKDNY